MNNTDTARYKLIKREDQERIAELKRREKELAAMQPIERILCLNGLKLVDTYAFDGIRMYEKRSGHTESVTLVYDGRLDEEAAAQVAAASKDQPGMITVLYTQTINPKTRKGPAEIRGLVPSDMGHFRQSYLENTNTGDQVAIEIQGFGKLEEKAVEQARIILEKARQRT